MQRIGKWMTVALLVMLPHAALAQEDDAEVSLSLPPASLGKWYKPASERHVWLHTMFRLRRAMLAVSEYAALGERDLLVKWAEQLVKDYRSIGEMVPEWKDELEVEWAEKLLEAARAGDAEGVGRAQRKIGISCNGCHKEFRFTAAALYRTPDFGRVKVEDSETLEEVAFHDAMEGLSISLNRLFIALRDGRAEAATLAREKLQQRLSDLRGSCGGCHENASTVDEILGRPVLEKLQQVVPLMDKNTPRKALERLGEVAVETCSRCHSLHRTPAELRELLSGE